MFNRSESLCRGTSASRRNRTGRERRASPSNRSRMILADTSIWIDHLRQTDPALTALLARREILAHPFVIGELALGSLKQRDIILARLSAFQAARDRVCTSRFRKRAGILTTSVIGRDIEKSGGDQRTRRTAAMASLKVGSFLAYQAAAWGRRSW
jgi:predicted nucleic acid-binding protein